MTSDRFSPPDGRFLSNGQYFTFITAAGTGQSRRHGHVVNRWLGDAVEDAHGQFIYLRDLESGAIWSVGMQPIQRRGTRYETYASLGQFHLIHECDGILAVLDCVVAPKNDFEVRRLRLTDTSGKKRRIEVTSYLEPVLTWQGADIGHPAFSKLFLQTEMIKECGALLAERRPRANNETWPCLFHSLAGTQVSEWETDRLRFLGRGRTAANPAGLHAPLSGSVGNVLDPCSSLRSVIELNPKGACAIAFLTGIAGTREAAIQITRQYQALNEVENVFLEAESDERKLLQDLKLTEAQSANFQKLASAMQYACRGLVPEIETPPLDANVNATFGKYRIPRDRPQVITAKGWDDSTTLEVLKARSYWATKGFFTNLIVLSDSDTVQPEGLDDRVFTLSAKDLDESDRRLLFAAASLVVERTLPEVIPNPSPTPPIPVKRLAEPGTDSASQHSEPLTFFNGYGGFSKDGTEYVVRLPRVNGSWKRPPLPWINVVANENAGFLVSESGAACTWARNSQANRLTPWSNEPVSDPHGEALYLRDEESGAVWSPMPGPIPGSGDYEVRHGLGYSQFLSKCHGLAQQVTLFVPRNDAVKITLLRLSNESDVTKKLSLTSYQQIVLGSLPDQPSLIVTFAVSDKSLRAVNLAAGDFHGGIAFGAMTLSGANTEAFNFTTDRLSFLGRHGSPCNPAALQQGARPDGNTGAGLDPCFVHQCVFTLTPGTTVECVVLLGESMTASAAADLVERYRNLNVAHAALQEARQFWRSLLSTIQIETPSQTLNIMVNGWLAYQTLCCRMWARSAFYQSSGAFGYRDQLQDSASLLLLDPKIARVQILLHARHQFEEGDVLHWWHPEPIERGLRTRFSDDLLWLPLITADYVHCTGDFGFLDTREPFLKAPLLQEGEDEVYLTPEESPQQDDLYDHCCRTIDRSLKTGAHGLPLMGVGDWNDGMSRVGREGRGESVWMGFFLYYILGLFIPLCGRRKDADRVSRYSEHRKKLYAALNEGGWDGSWYRRAYYDNGDPLGSALGDECKIDALAQAWAIISKAAPPDRAESSMAALSRELISEKDGLIRLLTPPFVNTKNDPGYIKGYVAGVRENGGQYTHAACWVVKSIAEYGDNNRALRLLEMLTPISHALTKDAADHYKVEPFAVAADIYGVAPHIGRGGWTWYTGSSGWMYRVAIESILGLSIEAGNQMLLRPCVPDDWPEFQIRYRPSAGNDGYDIKVENPRRRARNISSATLDGRPMVIQDGMLRVPLLLDGRTHKLHVVLG
jgi:cyclic beta-1,2-glucan synthetase